jgi:hypothetical protein
VAAVKLAGFLVLLAAIFVWAHVVGGTVGPVTTGHSQVQYTGSGGTAAGTDTGSTRCSPESPCPAAH